ncbi:MAG TPA: hypothetical protein VFP68_10760 [Burkholderiaceae bacterium]|nr:hypothetical protein [Burkholderiaceae bacterium]
MEIKVPFSQFYTAELQAAFERSGRPDETFFARCASVPGINAKYYARIGTNDAGTLARIEDARDIEDCSFSHPKIKSHFVRYYSYTAFNFHFMEVHARSHEKLRDHPELLAQAEQMVADSIKAASDEVDERIVKANQVMADNGVTQSVRYGVGPLLVPAEIVSPHCGTYLMLLMKADRLFSLLEYLRLRGYISNAECDKEFARVDRLLKGVQRTALRLATGLRRRLNVGPSSSGEQVESGAVGKQGAESEKVSI